MTRVDFYISQDSAPLARERIGCRLVNKAFSQGHRVHVHLADEAAARRVDDLLWTFSDRAFVPHAVEGDPLLEQPSDTPTVVLGFSGAPAAGCDVLINLGDDVPEFFSQVERVAEIIDGGERNRGKGRERFRFYRDRGYPLNSHNL